MLFTISHVRGSFDKFFYKMLTLKISKIRNIHYVGKLGGAQMSHAVRGPKKLFVCLSVTLFNGKLLSGQICPDGIGT